MDFEFVKMNIFTDLHHGDLYYSLHRLFVERLGFDLYRPIGLDWFNFGYWKIAEPYGNAMDTVNQYLEIREAAWDQHKCLNGNHYIEDGTYYIYDPVHDYYQKAITLEKFRSMKFDIIMSTYQPHDGPFLSLRDTYQSQAKLIAHLGNTGQTTILPNAIHSVPYYSSSNKNLVHCYQELDPKIYSYIEPPKDTKKITSVVNCFPYPNLWYKYKSSLQEVDMKNYGGGCPDGSLFGCKGVAEEMRRTNIAWHLKPQGGLGHSAMGWFASGRPIVTNMSQHRSWGGKAVELFIPGETCVDIESGSFQDNLKLLYRILEPEENLKWSERVRKKFEQVFNYNQDEENIRIFLGRLK